jgi:hypothetical protein
MVARQTAVSEPVFCKSFDPILLDSLACSAAGGFGLAAKCTQRKI